MPLVSGIDSPMVPFKQVHMDMLMLGGSGGFGTGVELPVNSFVLSYPWRSIAALSPRYSWTTPPAYRFPVEFRGVGSPTVTFAQFAMIVRLTSPAVYVSDTKKKGGVLLVPTVIIISTAWPPGRVMF